MLDLGHHEAPRCHLAAGACPGSRGQPVEAGWWGSRGLGCLELGSRRLQGTRLHWQDNPCAPLGAALWDCPPGREAEGSRVAGLAVPGPSCQDRAWALVRGLCPVHSLGWVCGAGVQLRGACGSSVLSRAVSWPQVRLLGGHGPGPGQPHPRQAELQRAEERRAHLEARHARAQLLPAGARDRQLQPVPVDRVRHHVLRPALLRLAPAEAVEARAARRACAAGEGGGEGPRPCQLGACSPLALAGGHVLVSTGFRAVAELLSPPCSSRGAC